jgi:hypothetical protein
MQWIKIIYFIIDTSLYFSFRDTLCTFIHLPFLEVLSQHMARIVIMQKKSFGIWGQDIMRSKNVSIFLPYISSFHLFPVEYLIPSFRIFNHAKNYSTVVVASFLSPKKVSFHLCFILITPVFFGYLIKNLPLIYHYYSPFRFLQQSS